jgi:hypothetical protein
MKSKQARLVRSICLSLLFVLAFFSAFNGKGGEFNTSRTLHYVSGSLLLIGALVHLSTNARWVRSIFKRSAGQLGKSVRQLRLIDSWLFISATVCAGTAIVWSLGLLGLDVPDLGRLHTLSGLAMSAFLFIHLIQHWGWLMCTIRSLGKSNQAREARAHNELPASS